jgi:hypothetical protein
VYGLDDTNATRRFNEPAGVFPPVFSASRRYDRYDATTFRRLPDQPRFPAQRGRQARRAGANGSPAVPAPGRYGATERVCGGDAETRRPGRPAIGQEAVDKVIRRWRRRQRAAKNLGFFPLALVEKGQ